MKINQKGFSAVEVLLILVIVALMGFMGWYVWHLSSYANNNHPKTTSVTKSTIPQDWSWYENKDLGLKFAYPAGWGTPHLTFADKGDTGMQYELDFYPFPTYQAVEHYNSRTPVRVSFASDDYSMRACNDGGCRTQVAMYTKTKIQQVLSSIANGSYSAADNGTLLSHDSKSFTTIATKVANTDGAHPDTVDLVDKKVIVALPKINVSDVDVDYTIIDTPSVCLNNALSNDSQRLCLNQNVVNTINTFTNSISALN